MTRQSPSSPPAELDDELLFVWHAEPFSVTLKRSILVWAILALVVALDRHFPAPPTSQAFIGFIISAIVAVASWFGEAASAAAAAVAAVVAWLTSALAWLGLRVVNIVSATGAMFAKVWDVTKALWFDVLKPAFRQIYSWIDAARQWLKRTLAPVFDLIAKVRAHVLDIYKHWVRPILDGLQIARDVLQLLAKLHISLAAALDGYLAEVQGAISFNYLKLLGYINQVTNTLNSIVTGDLLFQQVPFLRTLQRDAPSWINMWWNAQIPTGPRAPHEQFAYGPYELLDPVELRTELSDFYATEGGALAGTITELKPLWFASVRTE